MFSNTAPAPTAFATKILSIDPIHNKKIVFIDSTGNPVCTGASTLTPGQLKQAKLAAVKCLADSLTSTELLEDEITELSEKHVKLICHKMLIPANFCKITKPDGSEVVVKGIMVGLAARQLTLGKMKLLCNLSHRRQLSGLFMQKHKIEIKHIPNHIHFLSDVRIVTNSTVAAFGDPKCDIYNA